MRYEVRFKASAWKAFRKLQGEIRGRVSEALLELAENPRPSGVKKLAGREPYYRIRVRDYRVIYEIQDQVLVVLILKVGPRRDVYRNL